ncbi:hypothetical protein BKA61DRAFT_670219 [Leptodontidium sp. MPI-SDFR-AT-0119]|nr:hypothetical protein BKA61DRAFT_670219 [Leptodontidium sp. MPI-SDFR-AT-0119]
MTDTYKWLMTMMSDEPYTCTICGKWIEDPHAERCGNAEHEALGIMAYWEQEVNRRPPSKPKTIFLPSPPCSSVDGDKMNPIDLTGDDEDDQHPPLKAKKVSFSKTPTSPKKSPYPIKNKYEIHRGPDKALNKSHHQVFGTVITPDEVNNFLNAAATSQARMDDSAAASATEQITSNGQAQQSPSLSLPSTSLHHVSTNPNRIPIEIFSERTID